MQILESLKYSESSLTDSNKCHFKHNQKSSLKSNIDISPFSKNHTICNDFTNTYKNDKDLESKTLQYGDSKNSINLIESKQTLRAYRKLALSLFKQLYE